MKRTHIVVLAMFMALVFMFPSNNVFAATYAGGSILNIVPGDINGDGRVDVKDKITLARYLRGENVRYVRAALDTDGNGVINRGDYARLANYIDGKKVCVYPIDKYGFTWPAPGTEYVTQYYGERIMPASGEKRFHKGIDIPATMGTPVVAVADGEVVAASNNCEHRDKKACGCNGGAGNFIRIRVADGVEVCYYHLRNVPEGLFDEGHKVRRGDIVGYVGDTGMAMTPHLHFAIKENGKTVNPLRYIYK